MRTSWMLAGLPEVRRIDTFFGVTVREHGQQHATNSPCQCVAIGSCCDGFVETREANHLMSPKYFFLIRMPGLQAGKKTENFQAQLGRRFCTHFFFKTAMCW